MQLEIQNLPIELGCRSGLAYVGGRSIPSLIWKKCKGCLERTLKYGFFDGVTCIVFFCNKSAITFRFHRLLMRWSRDQDSRPEFHLSVVDTNGIGVLGDCLD